MTEGDGSTVAAPADDGGVDSRIDVCKIRFPANVVKSNSEVREAALAARIDVRGADVDCVAKRLAVLLDEDWQVDELFGKPTVLISVVGGAQDFQMSGRLQRVFHEGLVKAAQTTNAWVVTGGTSSGVMKHVGDALACYPDIPCIACAHWGNIAGSEAIEQALVPLDEVEVDDYAVVDYSFTDSVNSPSSAALEPRHTHFLFVDDGLSGPGAWGGELALRTSLELMFCEKEGLAQKAMSEGGYTTSATTVGEAHDLPMVLLIVQGGPNSLESVVHAVGSATPVVVVADSLGAAAAIRDFLSRTPEQQRAIEEAEEGLLHAEGVLRNAQAESNEESKRQVRLAKVALEKAVTHLLQVQVDILTPTLQTTFGKPQVINKLRFIQQRSHLIQLFEVNHKSDLETAILAAVANNLSLSEDKRLELAIAWDNKEMLGEILTRRARRASDALLGTPLSPVAMHPPKSRDSIAWSIQLALELGRPEVLAMLLSNNNANVSTVLISRLYMQTERNRFRLFKKLQEQVKLKASTDIKPVNDAEGASPTPRGQWSPNIGKRRAELITRSLSVVKNADVPFLRDVENWFLYSSYFRVFITGWLGDGNAHRYDFGGDEEAATARGAGGVGLLRPPPQVAPNTASRGARPTLIQDLFFYALLLGDQKLAHTLWSFSKEHIRLALLAADVLFRMMTVDGQGRKHRDEIEPMYQFWTAVANHLLEAIRAPPKDPRSDFTVATDVLMHQIRGETVRASLLPP